LLITIVDGGFFPTVSTLLGYRRDWQFVRFEPPPIGTSVDLPESGIPL